MTDLTRAYIKAFCETISVGIPSEREAAKAITQLLRQLDAAEAEVTAMKTDGSYYKESTIDKLIADRDAETARADAAAGQMRERCVAVCRTFIANNWPDLTEREMGAYNALLAISALPLHEEPQT